MCVIVAVLVIVIVRVLMIVIVHVVVVVPMLMAVFMPMPVHPAILQVHVKVKGVDSAFLRPAKVQVIAVHLQTFQAPLQPLSAGAQVQKGAHRHVSADS